MDLDLDLVPQREPNMSAYEIMLSESQERMLLCVNKGHEDDVKRSLTSTAWKPSRSAGSRRGASTSCTTTGKSFVTSRFPATDDVLEETSEEQKAGPDFAGRTRG